MNIRFELDKIGFSYMKRSFYFLKKKKSAELDINEGFCCIS